jgi:hypothetical protein
MTGQLFVQPNARSAGAQALVTGGVLNSVAREVLPRYDVPIMGGFAYSVPLHMAHPALRGTAALDCLHYCSYGLPEVRKKAVAARVGTRAAAPERAGRLLSRPQSESPRHRRASRQPHCMQRRSWFKACHLGLVTQPAGGAPPQILVYELTRSLRFGRGGVAPLEGVDTSSSTRQCVPL